MDLSCLSMLKELCLDGNPIVSMPDCVRTLPRLKLLFMRDCVMLGSIEHPPRTLLSLCINICHMSEIRKISFDQEMSPLDLQTNLIGLPASSIEIEGKILCLLHIDSNNVLSMHSLIQEMGRDEVRQESPDKPWKRSRLWCHEESFKVRTFRVANGESGCS
ncbi:Toll/interleukin-1 receptor domain-containing protein [Tanacetum coccineum]